MVTRTFLALSFGLGLCLSPGNAEAQPPRLTVTDYLLLLPAQGLFEITPVQILANLRDPKFGVIDKVNGYLRYPTDGAQPGFQVALFRYRDGHPLLAICWDDYEGPEAVTLEFFERGPGGIMKPASRAIFPLKNRKGRSFDLPRHGRTVRVSEKRAGGVTHSLTWDGERFVEEERDSRRTRSK